MAGLELVAPSDNRATQNKMAVWCQIHVKKANFCSALILGQHFHFVFQREVALNNQDDLDKTKHFFPRFY